jgi:hypothetical protein
MSDIVARLLASAEHSERCGWLTHAQLDREAAQTFIEVAAFLDRMADNYDFRLTFTTLAADCRAMAKKLRDV